MPHHLQIYHTTTPTALKACIIHCPTCKGWTFCAFPSVMCTSVTKILDPPLHLVSKTERKETKKGWPSEKYCMFVFVQVLQEVILHDACDFSMSIRGISRSTLGRSSKIFLKISISGSWKIHYRLSFQFNTLLQNLKSPRKWCVNKNTSDLKRLIGLKFI